MNQFSPFKLNLLLLLLATCVLLTSCKPEERKRPFGVSKIGKLADFQRPESFISEQGLLLRLDSGGLSAMSLLCTYDLAPLKVLQQGDKQILTSPYSTSTYDLNGLVLTGPAKARLPFYEVFLASGEYDGPADTLFVKIGTIKPPDWRLSLPLMQK